MAAANTDIADIVSERKNNQQR